MAAVDPPPPPPVLILGMHRSGTSAVSGLIHAALGQKPGAYLPGNAHNAAGYWEAKAVVGLNAELLLDRDRHWADPKPLHWTDPDLMDADADRVHAAIAEGFGARTPPVIKDPRLSLTLPVWTRALTTDDDRPICVPICVIVHRNPLSVYRSLSARNGLTYQHCEGLWLTYNLMAEYHSRGCPRVFVPYEDLMRGDATTALTRLSDALKPLAPAQTWIEAAETVLKRDLAHHRARPERVFETKAVSDLARDLFGVLQEDDPGQHADRFDTLRAAWLTGWAERSKGSGASHFAGRLPDWFLLRCKRALTDGQVTEAIAIAEEGVAQHPGAAALHLQLARAQLADHAYDAALTAATEALEEDTTRAPALALRARILRRMERLDEARADILAAIALRPGSADFHARLSGIEAALGNHDAARASIEQAIALAPDDPRHHLARDRLPESASPDKARPFAVVRVQTDNPVDLARIMADRGNLVGALGCLAPLLDGPVSVDAEVMTLAVKLQERLGLPRDVRDITEIRMEGAGLAPEVIFQAARACALTGDWDRATELRTRASEACRAMDDETIRTGISGLAISVRCWAEAGRLADQIGDLTAIAPFAPRQIAPPPGPAKSLSVMIPVYGVTDGTWLTRAVLSVLDQTYLPADAEIVLMNDGASDDAFLAGLCAHDPRMRVVHHPARKGLLQNHNACLETASGSFVHILHQDDFVEPRFYESLLRPLMADQSLTMAFCPTRVLDAEGRHRRTSARLADHAAPLAGALAHLVHSPVTLFPAPILRRSAAAEVGGFSEDLSFAFDWALWQRLAAVGGAWFDPAPMAARTNHPASATMTFTPADKLREALHVALAGLARLPAARRQQMARHVLFRVLEASCWQTENRLLPADPATMLAAMRDTAPSAVGL